MRLACVLAIAACGSEPTRHDQPPPPAAKDAAVARVPADAAPKGPNLDEIKAWMPKDPKAAWQGAWFLKLALRDAGMASFTGSYAALEIQGDTATAWVPATGKAYALGVVIDKPCSITFTQRDADGGTHYYRKTFTVEGGTLYAGEGGAGYRSGKRALVCLNDDIYVLDEHGKCRKYTERFGEWTVADATCTWSEDQPMWASFEKSLGKDTLAAGGSDQPNQFVGRNGILLNMFFRDAMFPKHGGAPPDFSKQPDFAAAKAAAERRWKETDSVELAKTAGGKPGETATILDVWATFKQDKSKLKGKPLSLTGKVIDKVEKRDVDGKPEWVVRVVDPRRFKTKDFAVRCRSPRQVARAEGATVTISGTVGEWWDDPALTACVVR